MNNTAHEGPGVALVFLSVSTVYDRRMAGSTVVSLIPVEVDIWKLLHSSLIEMRSAFMKKSL